MYQLLLLEFMDTLSENNNTYVTDNFKINLLAASVETSNTQYNAALNN